MFSGPDIESKQPPSPGGWTHDTFTTDYKTALVPDIQLRASTSSPQTLIVVHSSSETPRQVDTTLKSLFHNIQYAIRISGGTFSAQSVCIAVVFDGLQAIDPRHFKRGADNDPESHTDNPLFDGYVWDEGQDREFPVDRRKFAFVSPASKSLSAGTPSGPSTAGQTSSSSFVTRVVDLFQSNRQGRVSDHVPFDFEVELVVMVKRQTAGPLDTIALTLTTLCERLKPRYYMFVASGCELEPQSLDRLLGVMDVDSGIGVVSGRTQYNEQRECHAMLNPVAAQQVTSSVFHHILTQAPSGALGLTADICPHLFMLRVHAIESFGLLSPDTGVLKRFLESVLRPGERDVGMLGAARLLSSDIVTAPGCYWTANFEPTAVALIPACSNMLESCEASREVACAEIPIRKLLLLLSIPFELLLVMAKLLGPAHAFIVLFLATRLIPNTHAWGWLVFRSGISALFLVSFVLQVVVSLAVQLSPQLSRHKHAAKLLNLVAVVYSGLTLLVLVASFLKFHGHMSKIAFGLVMAVLCLSTLASLAGLRILSFLSTLCPWIVMSPCVILMQGTHGMLSYPSPIWDRLLAVSAWIVGNVAFCFAILGPDVGSAYLRGIVCAVSVALCAKLLVSIGFSCVTLIWHWRRDSLRIKANKSTASVPTSARGYVLSHPASATSHLSPVKVITPEASPKQQPKFQLGTPDVHTRGNGNLSSSRGVYQKAGPGADGDDGNGVRGAEIVNSSRRQVPIRSTPPNPPSVQQQQQQQQQQQRQQLQPQYQSQSVSRNGPLPQTQSRTVMPNIPQHSVGDDDEEDVVQTVFSLSESEGDGARQ